MLALFFTISLLLWLNSYTLLFAKQDNEYVELYNPLYLWHPIFLSINVALHGVVQFYLSSVHM